MLLYAKTEEDIQTDNVYQMHGNQITVRTLDLNLPFANIAGQLNSIAESHFDLQRKSYGQRGATTKPLILINFKSGRFFLWTCKNYCYKKDIKVHMRILQRYAEFQKTL